jgi:hypothetical protein
MAVLQSVETVSGGDNDAGLKRKFYFALHKDVLTWPSLAATPTTYAEKTTYTTPFVMKSTKRFWEIDLTTNKDNGLDSESAGSVGSLSSINKLRGLSARISPAIVGWIEEHKNDELVFIVEELDGQLKVVGDEGLPAMFESFMVQGGGKVGDDKQATFAITGPGRIAKYYGTVAVPLAIPLTPAA